MPDQVREELHVFLSRVHLLEDGGAGQTGLKRIEKIASHPVFHRPTDKHHQTTVRVVKSSDISDNEDGVSGTRPRIKSSLPRHSGEFDPSLVIEALTIFGVEILQLYQP